MYETQQEYQNEQNIQIQYKKAQLDLYQPNVQTHRSKQNYLNKRQFLLDRMFFRNKEIQEMIRKMKIYYQQIRSGFKKPDQQDTEVIVKQISKLQSREMATTVKVYNKLKVLTSKVKGIQSGKFSYPLQTFVNKMMENAKEQQKIILTVQSKDKAIIDSLFSIKKNFGILNEEALRYYKIHQTPYLFLNKNKFSEDVIFYINFNVQKLLFLNKKPLKYPNQLLYCPIICKTQQREILISEWYYKRLSDVEDQWQRYAVKIYVYHKETSMNCPIYTSYLRNIITQSNNHTHSTIVSQLKSVRNYVYQSMVWSWLGHILDSDKNRYYVQISENYRVQIVNERMMGKMGVEDGFRPQLMTSLILLSNENSNVNKSAVQLKQQIQILLKGLIFGLIAQKAEYRVNFPIMTGSLGQFYFDKRTSIRKPVDQFLSQF